MPFKMHLSEILYEFILYDNLINLQLNPPLKPSCSTCSGPIIIASSKDASIDEESKLLCFICINLHL